MGSGWAAPLADECTTMTARGGKAEPSDLAAGTLLGDLIGAYELATSGH
ncbi:hypothetical protein [Streptomyces cellostaticus]|nr:hypothetical protein [Streptomyces cellostaticus]